MSSEAILGISVKEYAKSRGKTVQAVYQQLKSKENADLITGHITSHRVGNKKVKFLDDTAVKILDEASSSAPIVIVEDSLKTVLEETTEKLKKSEKQVVYQDGQIQLLKELLQEQDKKILALSQAEDIRNQLDKATSELADEQAARQAAEAELKALKQSLSEEKQQSDTLKLELQAEKNRKISFREWRQRRKKKGETRDEIE